MTNAEKYLKDGVDVQDFVDDLRHMEQVMEWNGQQCLFICYIKDWLKEKIKPTLSEDEKVILRQLDDGFSHIGRYNEGAIYVKEGNKGYDYYGTTFDIYYGHLFQFIQPRRRI